MHVVVCTVVHHPADARIFYREIQALLDAGHDVTYIAPHDEQQPERARASTDPVPRPTSPDRDPGTGARYPAHRHHSPGRRPAPARRAARRAGRHGRAGGRRGPAARPRPRAAARPAAEAQAPADRLGRARGHRGGADHEGLAARLAAPGRRRGSGLRRAPGRAQAAPDPRRARLQRPLRRHPPGGAQHDVRPGSGGPAVRPAPRRVRRLALPGPRLGGDDGTRPPARRRTASRSS